MAIKQEEDSPLVPDFNQDSYLNKAQDNLLSQEL